MAAGEKIDKIREREKNDRKLYKKKKRSFCLTCLITALLYPAGVSTFNQNNVSLTPE